MEKQRQLFEERVKSIELGDRVTSRASLTRKRATPDHERVVVKRALRPIRTTIRVLLVFAAFLSFKAGFAEYVGTANYDAQVELLARSEGWSPAKAMVMQRGVILRWAEPGFVKINQRMGLSGSEANVAWPDFLTPNEETGA
ncbi:MAG: hypothetical protein AAF198_01470 [Pseudomonadota bacterium]